MIRERAVQFGTDQGLAGVLCEPRARTTADDDPPAVLLLNAGLLHHVGPSRLHVQLSRTLAAVGVRTLRFDFSGIGDSAPRTDGLNFDEACVLEVQAAIEFLAESRGIRTVVAGGICSGADAAFRAALADDRVVGLISVDGYAYRNWKYYLHHYGPRLIRWEAWTSFTARHARSLAWRLGLPGGDSDPAPWSAEVRTFPPREEASAGLQALSDRGVPQLHVYTGGQKAYQNYAGQFWDNFREVEFRGLAEQHYLGDADHTFTSPTQQALLIQIVVSWTERRRPQGRPSKQRSTIG